MALSQTTVTCGTTNTTGSLEPTLCEQRFPNSMEVSSLPRLGYNSCADTP